jgi:hypothetical protein
MLLRALGRGDEAREAAGEIVRGMKRAPAHVRRNQARWFSQARKLERA